MGYLLGLKEYLKERYNSSIFDQAVGSKQSWEFQLHGHRVVRATIVENLTYDLRVDIKGQGEEDLPKIQIKFLYPADVAESVEPLIRIDGKIRVLGLGPIRSPAERFYVKNKSLFPLMKERQVVFFTLLEGETIRGIVVDFNKYEITISLKGGVPVTILRHSIYDLRDKKGRRLLKSFQEKHRDWQKSDLFVS